MAQKAPKPDDGDEGAQPADKPRRKSKVKGGDAPPVVLDEATFQHHVQMIQGAHLRLEDKLKECASERAVLGNAKKAAKKAGVPVDAVMMALRLKKREAGEVVTEFRNVGKVLKILEAPLGTQWGLFTDVEVVDVMDADAAGFHAGKNNEFSDNNPHAAGTEEHQKWHGGWLRAQAELAPGASRADPVAAKLDAEFEAEGYAAYGNGVSLADNPYGEGTKANPLWNAGWKSGQTQASGAGEAIPAFLDKRKKGAGARATVQ